MQNIKPLLDYFHRIRPLSGFLRWRLGECCEQHSFQKDQSLVEENTIPQALYYVVWGHTETFQTVEGERVITQWHVSGEILCHALSLLAEEATIYGTVALTDVHVIALAYKEIRPLLIEQPMLYAYFLKILTIDLVHEQQRGTILAGSSHTRLIKYVRRFGGYFLPGSPDHLCQFLGISRTNFLRQCRVLGFARPELMPPFTT